MNSRETMAAREHEFLAPYAMFSGTPQRRRHPEDPHPLRTDFQRDRDRVIHSRAFRRLEYKTQVFVNGVDDHFRTRLTHTIEVAGIARTIARGLRLNEDLAEAISLAHDLGHPPFGHCGERMLNRLLAEHGGFDHNLQALVVVDDLEDKYPGYQGLNLTFTLRSGLLKHRHQQPVRLDGEPLPPRPYLEAQVADLADDLTYYSHDLDDALSAGLLSGDDLAGLALWQAAVARVGSQAQPGDRCYYPYLIRNLIDLLVADVVAESTRRLAAARPADAATAEHWPEPLIAFSPAFAAACVALRDFLFEHMYFHRRVLHDNELSAKWMQQLFAYFLEHPETLGRAAQARLPRVGLHRAVADYIAGMTDRYAIEQYRQFIGGEAPPEDELTSSFLDFTRH